VVYDYFEIGSTLSRALTRCPNRHRVREGGALPDPETRRISRWTVLTVHARSP
jgi:hypothetical protein